MGDAEEMFETSTGAESGPGAFRRAATAAGRPFRWAGNKAKDGGKWAGGKATGAGKWASGKATGARQGVDSKLAGMGKHGATATGAGGGAVAGAGAGAGAGAAVGSLTKMFSKERKAWRSLVKQEKMAHKNGANAASLKKIHDAKMKAKAEYVKIRNAAAKKGAKIGGAVGAVGGAIAGGMYGRSRGTAA